jgi:anti-anti-sigma regulatory factor
MERVKKIVLSDVFDVQLTGRFAVDSIFTDISGVHHLILDFSSIAFISRSAAHQLLSRMNELQSDRITVEIISLDSEVSKMINRVRQSIRNPKKLATYVEFLNFASEEELEDFVLSF